MQRARTSTLMCGSLLFAMNLAACSLTPGFDELNGEEIFECPLADDAMPLRVAFNNHEATIVDRSKSVTLQFVQSVWPRMEDRYAGDGYSLTIDPEVYLTRPDGSTQGPCL